MYQFTPNKNNTKRKPTENKQKEKWHLPTKKTHKNKTKYKISLYIITSLAVFFYSFTYKCRADFLKRSNTSFPDTYYSFY